MTTQPIPADNASEELFLKTARRLLRQGNFDLARNLLEEALQGENPSPRIYSLYMRCCSEGRTRLETNFGGENVWVVALDELISGGFLDAGGETAKILHAAFPKQEYFFYLRHVLASMPPPPDPAFLDDEKQEVQILARECAQTVLLVFAGGGGQHGIHLNILHRWFARLQVHLVYLRDFQGHAYIDGIPTLAGHAAATVDALKRIITELGARRVLCYGTCQGGYAALDYGLELDAQAVLSMAGQTNLERDFVGVKMLRRHDVEHGGQRSGLDLRARYAAALKTPRVHLVYGAKQTFDARQARHMACLPSVSLEALEGLDDHNVLKTILLKHKLDEMLHWLTDPLRGNWPAAASLRIPDQPPSHSQGEGAAW